MSVYLDPQDADDLAQENERLRGEVCRLEQALRDAGVPSQLIDLLREGS